MGLSESEIIELGKRTANAINGHTDAELFDPAVKAEIHLGLVVTKDAMLNPDTAQVQRTVPEDTDS